MNYMVSTYNETLFTTAAAKFSATAAVAAPTENAAEADENTAALPLKTHLAETVAQPLLSDFLRNTAPGRRALRSTVDSRQNITALSVA